MQGFKFSVLILLLELYDITSNKMKFMVTLIIFTMDKVTKNMHPQYVVSQIYVAAIRTCWAVRFMDQLLQIPAVNWKPGQPYQWKTAQK